MEEGRPTRNLKRKIVRSVMRAMPPVIRIPSFRNLWIGQGVSQFGDALYYMVFTYMVDKVTQSSEVAGAAMALKQLPYLLLGFHAGTIADRIDRRKVMLGADLGSAFMMLVLLTLILGTRSHPPAWALLLVGFVVASFSAIFDPARNAAIPMLVPPEKLIEATSLSTSTRNLMQFASPLASTALIPVLSTAGSALFFPIAITVNLVTFLYSAVCIGRLPTLNPRADEEEHHAASPRGVVSEFMDGIRFFGTIKMLKIGLGLTMMLNLIVAPVYVGLLAANRLWFSADEKTFAGMQAAFFLGMIVTGLVVMKRGARYPGLSYSLAILGAGVTIGFLAVAKSYWTFYFLLFGCGLAMPYAVIPLSTYMQLLVPDKLRGRVNSALNMLQNIVLSLGFFISGSVIQHFGVHTMFFGLGVALLITGAIGLFNNEFRTTVMPHSSAK